MQKTIFICQLLLLTGINLAANFDTLDDIVAYAQTHNEFPPADDTNWIDPNYNSYLAAQTPNRFTRFLYSMHLLTPPAWTAEYFVDTLKKITDYRIEQALPDHHIGIIKCSKPTRFFIWGDLHGAFHSLVRDLVWFKEQGIIDNSLKIIEPNCYFVLNGDSVSRSAYILEALTVIFILMLRNKDRFIYLRGKHETNNYWQNFGTKREMRIRLGYLSAEKIPLGDMLSTFFSTLPEALFITTNNDLTECIRLSHAGREDEIISDEQLYRLFTDQKETDQITYPDIEHLPKKIDGERTHIKVIIKTEDWMREHRAVAGLGLLMQDQGATAWSVLSSPIPIHQKFYNFYYDAFAELAIDIPLLKSTISLYNRDSRTKEPFIKSQSFNITGKIGVNSLEEEIRLGSTLSLVEGVPIMGQLIERGMFARIEEANKKGGIRGHFIRLFIYNDNYSPYLARKNIQKLIKRDKADMILLPIGSPTLSAYLNYIRDDTILTLFPVTGGPQFRDPELKGLINLRASYADEVKVLIHRLFSHHDVRRFAFFYQDDSYGTGPLETAHKTLKELGITEWVDIPYTRSSIDFKEQVQKIANSQPDAIGLFSTALATEEFFRQLGPELLVNRRLFGISFLGEETFRRFIKKVGITVLFGAVVPNPSFSDLPIVQEYRAAMDIYHHDYDAFSLEAYIGTSLLLEVMQQTPGRINRKHVKTKLESLKDYQFKGMNFTFDPQTRSLAQSVWIETSKDEPWEQFNIHDHLTLTTTTSEMHH